MSFTEGYDICFSYKRLSAGINIEITAEFFALLDNSVKFFKRKIKLVSVFCRPAACTFEIAGRGRIYQHGPRYIALVLCFVFPLNFASDERIVHCDCFKCLASHARINV
ncbi:hypothetical protein SDC9_171256 [bioreactor metagenome]|uniref:Uncharacterized protein n=1 Tax=bioreactor metagenome TaxID=1076179 RepID=A0A645GJH0_9ZZZZ